MRVEDRSKIMDAGTQIICICEDEEESKIVDLLGKPNSKVTGELRLSDDYGEFYIRLEPQIRPKQSEFTKEVRQFIIRKTAVEGINNLDKFLSQYGAYMTEALDRLDAADALNEQLVMTIEEVIELMDEEPAKEILRKAVSK